MHGEDIDNKAVETLSKNSTDCFQSRVMFKSEWEGCYHMNAIKNESLVSLSLTWKNLFCYHKEKYDA